MFISPVSDLGAGGFILFWCLFALAVGLFSRRMYRLLRSVFMGGKENRLDHLGKRIQKVIFYTFGQKHQFESISLRDRAEISHILIAWAFFLFALSYLIFIFICAGFGISFQGWAFFAYYSYILDIIGALCLFCVIWAAVRRFVVKPPRLEQSLQAAVIQTLIALLMITHFFIDAFHMAGGATMAVYPPISHGLSFAFDGMSVSSLEIAYNIFWWLHLCIILGFLVFISYSKHRYIILGPLNHFFSSLRPKGALKPIDLENTETFGASKITDFTWKQNLDLLACVVCGRCQDSCPAYLSGKSLNPKELIGNLRDHMLEVGPELAKERPLGAVGLFRDVKAHLLEEGPISSGDEEGEGHPLIGEVISEDAIWSCTTCRACMQACPAMNEHIDKIIELRRSLVLEQAQMPETVMETLRSIETRGHPWRGTVFTRTHWAADLGVKELSQSNEVDVLYWVGCTPALDDRCQKVAQAMAMILNAAGVKFAILGDEESCCGDPARRMGNEYLFQLQAQRNIETLKRYNVRKIVTTCPHCFNTIKNEYPQFGGDFEVMHHTQFIAQLLREGKLEPIVEMSKRTTYHDPCYLGRYHDIYEEPREILLSIPRLKFTELDRKREEGFRYVGSEWYLKETPTERMVEKAKERVRGIIDSTPIVKFLADVQRREGSFCCGGGGGRCWMEETGTRISHLRTDDAIRAEAEVLAVACPFCMIMFEDAVKAKEVEEKLKVMDIAELVAQVIA